MKVSPYTIVFFKQYARSITIGRILFYSDVNGVVLLFALGILVNIDHIHTIHYFIISDWLFSRLTVY